MKEMSLTATSIVDSSTLKRSTILGISRKYLRPSQVGVSAYLMTKMWNVELQK
jgi:hypothetical protein